MNYSIRYICYTHEKVNCNRYGFIVWLFILYPLTIVPKQKRATEKPRETTVKSVDIVPAKLHTHTPIIAPVAKIRVNSLRMLEKNVVYGIAC